MTHRAQFNKDRNKHSQTDSFPLRTYKSNKKRGKFNTRTTQKRNQKVTLKKATKKVEVLSTRKSRFFSLIFLRNRGAPRKSSKEPRFISLFSPPSLYLGSLPKKAMVEDLEGRRPQKGPGWRFGPTGGAQHKINLSMLEGKRKTGRKFTRLFFLVEYQHFPVTLKLFFYLFITFLLYLQQNI